MLYSFLLVILLLFGTCQSEHFTGMWLKPFREESGELDCPTGKEKWMPHIQIPWGVAERAALTLPPGLRIAPSSIPGAGRGVIATTFIPRYTWLAEYEGEIVRDVRHISAYAWVIFRGGDAYYYVDAYNPRTSNWPRWVNCARHVKEQNLSKVRCRGRVFYIAIEDIVPGQELLVYYGHNYARSIDLNVENYYNMGVDVRLYQKYACWNIQSSSTGQK